MKIIPFNALFSCNNDHETVHALLFNIIFPAFDHKYNTE